MTFQRSFYIDVLTDASVGTEILLQLEDSSEAQNDNFSVGRHNRYSTKDSVRNKWERISFQYSDLPDEEASPK